MIRSRKVLSVLMAALLVPTAHVRAWSFDPLLSLDKAASGPAKEMLAGGDENVDPCRFDSLGTPLGLVEAVERALCHNPQSRQAWANAKVQAAQVGVARSAYLPTVGATVNYSKQKTKTEYEAYPQANSDVHPTIRSGGLKMSLVLTDFGLRRANLDQALALVDAANASHDATLQSAFLAAAQAYFETQAALATVDAAREAERAAKESFAAAEAKYKAGVGALTDQLQAQTAYSKALVERVTAEGELNNALGTLATAMGLPANTPITLAKRPETLPDTSFVKPINDLLEDAQLHHPALVAAQAQLVAAQAKLDAVKAEGRPNVTLASELNRSDQINYKPAVDLDPTKIATRSSSVGVQVNIPLFEGFGRSYRVQAALEQAEVKRAEMDDTRQKVVLEVWKSYQALRTEGENMNASEDLVKSARQSFKVAQGRYKAGVGNMLELLNAQSAQANAEQQRIKSISKWHTARLKLAASVGKLGMWAIK